MAPEHLESLLQRLQDAYIGFIHFHATQIYLDTVSSVVGEMAAELRRLNELEQQEAPTWKLP
jgi:hypothetical protein